MDSKGKVAVVRVMDVVDGTAALEGVGAESSGVLEDGEITGGGLEVLDLLIAPVGEGTILAALRVELGVAGLEKEDCAVDSEGGVTIPLVGDAKS